MKRLPQLTRFANNNAPGLDLVRLIDVRDIVSMIPDVLLWSEVYNGTLPKGGIVPSQSSVWIDMFFAPGLARYTCVNDPNNHGPLWKNTLALPISGDSPLHAQTAKMLSKGRWIAMAMDANDVIRLIGSIAQPLKLRQGNFGTAPNEWGVELISSSPNPAAYLSSWDDLYGNPADYSFDFSLDFNA